MIDAHKHGAKAEKVSCEASQSTDWRVCTCGNRFGMRACARVIVSVWAGSVWAALPLRNVSTTALQHGIPAGRCAPRQRTPGPHHVGAAGKSMRRPARRKDGPRNRGPGADRTSRCKTRKCSLRPTRAGASPAQTRRPRCAHSSRLPHLPPSPPPPPALSAAPRS